MSVIDPHLDGVTGASGGPVTDLHELAMLRHDLEGALAGIAEGVRQIDPARLGADGGLQLERIAAAARMLGRLVRAALDAPPAALAPALDLARFLHYVRRRHAGAAAARGLAFCVETEGVLPETLRLDPLMMARLVDNLLANAIGFSPAGTVRLVVGRELDGRLVLRVLDDGPGIAPEALARILLSPALHGLGVAKALTARLGGELALRNRQAGGFEAALSFPAEVAPEPRAPLAPGGLPDLRGLRVLLAEDNPTNQMVASQMMRALNAEVTVCADGIEALERFDERPVDLVVVDIEMPRLSGLDVIRAIRARGDARAQVPIVALTAYAMREHRERIAAAGANGLISKPITSVEALRRGLAAHLTLVGPPAEAADPGATPTGPVIDAAIFAALVEAIGADTMGELLDKVTADLLAAQRELVGALASLDPAPIRSASHILISVAGALGAVRLQACARALNGAAHGEAGDDLGDGVRSCIAEIDAAVAFARARRAEA